MINHSEKNKLPCRRGRAGSGSPLTAELSKHLKNYENKQAFKHSNHILVSTMSKSDFASQEAISSPIAWQS